jgi:murein DD-endopeptidase MepM/ murein hydrolase activator NlpD
MRIPFLSIGFVFTILLCIANNPVLADTTTALASNPTSSTVQDELLKNFMAGLTYTPTPIPPPDDLPLDAPALPDQPTGTAIASMNPTLPADADQTGTDADVALPEPVLPKAKPKKAGKLSFIKPVLNAIVSSNFGKRWGRMHEGVDLAVASGTPIHAAERGTVRFSGWSTGYGNLVILDHGGGVTTRYGHASKLLVHNGQTVKKGQTIALVGSTGHSTGPHLHFEIRTQNTPKNPLGYINQATPLAAHTLPARVQ